MCTAQVDSFEDEQELGVVQRKGGGATGLVPGEVKTPALKAFLKEPISIVGEVQDAGAVPSPGEEEEERAAERVEPKGVTVRGGESIDASASVDGLDGGEDADGGWKAQHAALTPVSRVSRVATAVASTGPLMRRQTPPGKRI